MAGKDFKNPKQVDTASKVKLVVTGSGESDKLLRDLPVEEFLKVLDESTPEQLETIVKSFDPEVEEQTPHQLVSDSQALLEKVKSTIFWWERRRLLYNLIVGLSGSLSLLFLVPMYGWQLPLLCAAVYGFMANVCYCLGAPAEVVAKLCFGPKAGSSAELLFTLGTIFSVIITFCIGIVTCLAVALHSM